MKKKKILSMSELVFELGGIKVVSKLFEVTPTTVWRWENNKVKMDKRHYRAIMKKTGLTFQELEAINVKAE